MYFRSEIKNISLFCPKCEITYEDKKVQFCTCGEKLEPMEEVQIDVDSEFVGSVVESMNLRKGQMQDMRETGAGKTRRYFCGDLPARSGAET